MYSDIMVKFYTLSVAAPGTVKGNVYLIFGDGVDAKRIKSVA